MDRLSLVGLGLTMLFCVDQAGAQAPVELVLDLNPAPAYDLGSAPIFTASDGQRAWFWAHGQDQLVDLWISDGTAAGTQPVLADMTEGLFMVAEHYDGGVVLPSGRAVFIAPSAEWPASKIFGQPVGSDGTAAGTAILDSGLSVSLRAASEFVEFAGEAWFCAQVKQASTTVGLQLWRSDGTGPGTAHGFDAGVIPPPQVRGPIVAGGGDLYFSSQLAEVQPGTASSVWRTDGSGSAPSLVFTGPVDSRVEVCSWLPTAGRLIVLVEHVFGQSAIPPQWWSIGPGGAEFLVESTIEGSRWCARNGDAIYLVGREGPNPTQLFISDGTAAGTSVVPDNAQLLANAVGNNPGRAYKHGLVCLAWDPFIGLEPAFVDPTGVTALVDAQPGGGGSQVTDFVEFGGEVYFHARQGPSQPGHLYRTDGTPAGTLPIPGADVIGSAPLFSTGRTQAGILYAYDLGNGIGSEPWRADASTVTLIADIAVNGTAGSLATPIGSLGSRLVVSANDGSVGLEPWVTDGTDAGTQLLADLVPGASGSMPAGGARVGGRLAFSATVAELGAELILTDGDPDQVEVVDLNPGPASSLISNLVAAGDHVYFSANALGPAGVAPGLWRSDGTAVGTQHVAYVGFKFLFGQAVLFDGGGVGGADVFFIGVDSAGSELWRSDGTAAGTFRVADIRPGPLSSEPRGGVAIGDRFFFTADDGINGREVWSSDGTAGGVSLAAEILPGPGSGAGISGGVAFEGNYVLTQPAGALPSGPIAVNATTGAVKYLIDPQLAASDPLLGGAATGGFLVTDGGLLFATVDPQAGLLQARLWRVPGATSFAKPIDVPIATGIPMPVTQVGAGYALFAGVDAAGIEPRVLGPNGKVSLLADLNPGPGSSNPSRPWRIGSRVVFSAQEPAVGLELFRTTVAAVGANVAAPLAGGCAQVGEPGVLSPVGRPTLGADFDLRLEFATPAAPVVWAIGSSFAYPDVGAPCQPLLPQPVALALGLTDASGAALLDLAIPADPSLLDLELAFQALVVEVPGPFLGISSLSDGLEVVIGP
ncbi:hypothetical protein [Engelhardtia mirabilis]|uniref:Uncharacterized protein n=1 Tax=Engelhardtia mirabilis TaxID=2528011 RepID=A0A518BDU4_9BACT|nr:hypothetical protein Pla133_01960 [Planctomycetes bacterium Pla133]QDU99458.1 hypothetical protein Pla86_01960 [Planctomycetes bacterium Pla86]